MQQIRSIKSIQAVLQQQTINELTDLLLKTQRLTIIYLTPRLQ